MWGLRLRILHQFLVPSHRHFMADTAIHRAPFEIWATIINRYLWDDPLIFPSILHLPSINNIGTSQTVSGLRERRNTLRLVCKSWNSFVSVCNIFTTSGARDYSVVASNDVRVILSCDRLDRFASYIDSGKRSLTYLFMSLENGDLLDVNRLDSHFQHIVLLTQLRFLSLALETTSEVQNLPDDHWTSIQPHILPHVTFFQYESQTAPLLSALYLQLPFLDELSVWTIDDYDQCDSHIPLLLNRFGSKLSALSLDTYERAFHLSSLSLPKHTPHLLTLRCKFDDILGPKEGIATHNSFHTPEYRPTESLRRHLLELRDNDVVVGADCRFEQTSSNNDSPVELPLGSTQKDPPRARHVVRRLESTSFPEPV